jgi:hypothetical protein
MDPHTTGATAMRFSHIGMILPPLLAVSISLLLIYAFFGLAGLAPLPFACSLHDAGVTIVRHIDLEII